MKNKITFTVIILISFIHLCNGQNNSSEKLDFKNLYGVWEVQTKTNNENIELIKRQSHIKAYEGSLVIFNENGGFISGESNKTMKGTNEKRIEPQKGTWLINEKKMILKTSVPIANHGMTFEILELNSERFILLKI